MMHIAKLCFINWLQSKPGAGIGIPTHNAEIVGGTGAGREGLMGGPAAAHFHPGGGPLTGKSSHGNDHHSEKL